MFALKKQDEEQKPKSDFQKQMEIQRLMEKRKDAGTNHFLHLLLCCLSFGLWLPVWFIFSMVNGAEREMIDKKIKKVIDE